MTAFVLSHQLAIVFAVSVLIIAGMAIQELSAKRHRDREDARARQAAAAGKLAAETLAADHLAVERHARYAVPEHREAPIGRRP